MDVDEAYLRRLAEPDDIVDARDAELYRALDDALALEEGEIPSHEQVLTAARAEGPLLSAVKDMDYYLRLLRRGAASTFASRPGEEALVEALLSQAATLEAARDGVMATVEAGHLMQEDDLRRMAAAAEEDVVDPEKARVVIRQASRDMELLKGARAVLTYRQVLAAEYAAQTMVTETDELAGRLRKGAAEFASRPGEEAVAVALQSKAASAERHVAEARDVVATYRTFRHSLPFEEYESMDIMFSACT